MRHVDEGTLSAHRFDRIGEGQARGDVFLEVHANHLASLGLDLARDGDVERDSIRFYVGFRREATRDGVVIGDAERSETKRARPLDEFVDPNATVGREARVEVKIAEDRVGGRVY